MTTLCSLDDYRQAIAQATNGQDLELLIYRALPTLYESMGIPYVNHQHVSVSTRLHRDESEWKLWFNIEIPQAIAALSYLAPDIFHRMSGGRDQASAITTQKLGKGFSKTCQDFVMEPVLEEQAQHGALRLNNAASLHSWWNTFYEELPAALFRTRGWTQPNEAQHRIATSMAQKFREKHGKRLEQHFKLSGNVRRANTAEVTAAWSESATNLSDRIDRVFYPLFSHHPWMKLGNSAVHSFNISEFNTTELSAALCERAKPIVWAHCNIAETKAMPIYLLMEAMAEDFAMESFDLLPDIGEAPAPF